MTDSIYLQFFGWLIALALLVVYLSFFGLSHLYDFRIGKKGIDIILFKRWRIASIDFNSIEDVYLEKLGHQPSVTINPFRALRVGNRLIHKYVMIKNNGFINFIMLTPANPEVFYEEVKKHIASRSRGK